MLLLNCWLKVKEMIDNKRGQGMIEYVLIAALISIVAIVLMGGVGDQVKATFESVKNALTPTP